MLKVIIQFFSWVFSGEATYPAIYVSEKSSNLPELR